MEELQGFVKDYQVTFKSSDAQEWELVLQEISTFLDAEKSILPVDYEGLTVQFSTRIKSDSKFKSGDNPLRIQEAVICGNNTNQVETLMNIACFLLLNSLL